MAIDGTLVRKAHTTLEPLHATVYFLPEPREAYAAAGAKGGLRGYFGSRSSPLGVVAAEVVIATFYNFAPAAVRRAVPGVWETTTPAAMAAARLAGVDAAWRRVLGQQVLDCPEMAEAAELARTAATDLSIVGRPLFAAHAALPWPQETHLQLFWAQTLLREHRGDGHIAALVLEGLDGLEALVGYVPMGQGLDKATLQATRGWSQDEWDAAEQQLIARGLLEPGGGFTEAGRAQRERIEAATDAAAASGWRRLGEPGTQRLRELARPWSKALVAAAFGG